MTLHSQFSADLPAERVHLAAAYRLIAEFGMDDSIFTHISARAPAEEGEHAFLINPYGLRFDEVTVKYGEFGDFYIGIQLPLDELFRRVGL